MLNRRPLAIALLCATATVSGLAGGYFGTLVATDPEAEGSSRGDRALLSREQDFPPTENWPDVARQPLRNVLFEDAAPNSEWLADQPAIAEPTRSRQAPMADARPDYDFAESPEDAVAEANIVEANVEVQAEVNLLEGSEWDTVEPVLDAAIADTADIEGLTAEAAQKPAVTADYDSAGAASLDSSGPGAKMTSDEWALPDPQPLPAAGSMGSDPETLL